MQRVKAFVKQALDLGINHFDTAPWYGNSEYLLGVGLQGHPRSSYYLATKIGQKKRTIESVEKSLKL